MEEGWKLIGLDTKGNIRSGTNNLRKAPKHSTVNREVTACFGSGLSIRLFLMV